MPLNVIGVVKAYTTRVGGGPFPTEQKNYFGDTLQKVGREIAATSGRIRRCGWLDIPILRYSESLNRFSSFMITKLDVLSVFNTSPISVGSKMGKKTIDRYPAISHDFYRCRPVYKILKGWKKDISKVRRWKDLPIAAQKYVRFVEQTVKVPVTMVSVGPGRDDNIAL